MSWRTEAIKAALRNRPERLTQFFTPRQVIPPDRNTREFLETYGHSPRMSPITKIATDLAPIEGHLYRIRKDGEREEIEDHPFLDFMRRPNPLPEMTKTALWSLVEKYLLIKGESACIIERDKAGYPVELWPVPTHWVLSLPALGRPYYVVMSRDGRQREVPVEDVFIQRELNPLDPYGRGLGMAEAVADEIETDEYMAKWAKKFFYNDATPPVVLSVPGLTSTEFERFEAKWNEKYRGIGNSHKLGLLSREATPHKLGDTRKEMDFTESRKDLRDAIMTHFGIPPEIMGVVENSNRATVTQAKTIYAENVQQPRLYNRQDAVNIQLLSAWGDDLVYEYDEVIPEDTEFKLQVANAGMQYSTILLDEWRDQMGFDPLDGDSGKVIYIPLASMPTKPSELTQRARQNTTGGAFFDGLFKSRKRIKSDPRRAQFTRRLSAQLQQADELLFAANVQRYFDRQLEHVLLSMQTGHKDDSPDFWARLMGTDITLDIAGLRELAASALDELINWEQQADELATLMTPLWDQAFKDGAKNCENAYGLKTVSAPVLTDRLRKHGLERVKEITNTTRDKLANALADGIEAGESREQLIKRIQEHMPDIQRERAAGIAMTEAHTSIQEGNMAQMQYAGVRTKTWRTAGDHDVRDIHRQLEGVMVPIDKPFPNGLMYPGDPSGKPGDIIRCRCYLEPGEL